MSLSPDFTHQKGASLRVPPAWYLVGSVDELAKGPRSVYIGDAEYVAFQTADGRSAVLDGRCVHIGAQLSRGCVVGEHLQCPFHAWEFDRGGVCRVVPASTTVPPFAKQRSYPTANYNGLCFFFNAAEAVFALPTYLGKVDGALTRSKPFGFDLELPWYMVAANGFDLQHFRTAHDRKLASQPVVSSPTPPTSSR
jgi:aminopyrrolnitrin oxygenase